MDLNERLAALKETKQETLVYLEYWRKGQWNKATKEVLLLGDAQAYVKKLGKNYSYHIYQINTIATGNW